MNFNNNLPIYIQIMDYMKKLIVTGELKEGDRLPSVRELSGELKVNPNTIQRSYQELEREGLVFTQRGMGTFVSEDIEMVKKLKSTMALGIVQEFIIEMKSIGFDKDGIIDLIRSIMEGDRDE